jgi:hypothetical protein
MGLETYLIDGYLPQMPVLEQVASLPSLGQARHIPVSWEGHDMDSMYERIAYDVRDAFCRSRRAGKRSEKWCEAWLLKPSEKWDPEFDLKISGQADLRRRLLIALYRGCDAGRQCVRRLIRETRIEVIAREHYRDPEAFNRKAEFLLEEVTLPFRAPCIVAGERLERNGYVHSRFGR